MSRTTDQFLDPSDLDAAFQPSRSVQRIAEGALLMTLSTIDLSVWCHAAYNGVLLFSRM